MRDFSLLIKGEFSFCHLSEGSCLPSTLFLIGRYHYLQKRKSHQGVSFIIPPFSVYKQEPAILLFLSSYFLSLLDFCDFLIFGFQVNEPVVRPSDGPSISEMSEWIQEGSGCC